MDVLTEAEALAGLAFCAMCTDGHIAEEEFEVLRERLAELPDFRDATDAELGVTLSRVDRLARKDGEAAFLLRVSAAVPPERRAEAYRLVASIVAADDDEHWKESDFLRRCENALCIPGAEARAILKRRGADAPPG